MKRGNTEVETLHLNGWGVGDILEGFENNKKMRILITSIGHDRFLCKWDHFGDGFGHETGTTTLEHREWRKIGEDKEIKRSAEFWGRVASNQQNKIELLKGRLDDSIQLLKSWQTQDPQHHYDDFDPDSLGCVTRAFLEKVNDEK